MVLHANNVNGRSRSSGMVIYPVFIDTCQSFKSAENALSHMDVCIVSSSPLTSIWRLSGALKSDTCWKSNGNRPAKCAPLLTRTIIVSLCIYLALCNCQGDAVPWRALKRAITPQRSTVMHVHVWKRDAKGWNLKV